ncbi:hypothetical protein IEQ34_022062 [Dendrobium chrysotoxum]|uniref:Uncharacterized protein n=1 Tax=Dendrobium chrysotoxum TaxID=161865 RepID=A0AAV7FXW3_DENCH|nr:hypothetical protein IEQ34_022062 [Dendrobium chrysotoxum]
MPLKTDNVTAIGLQPSLAHVLVELDIIKRYPDRVWLRPKKFGYVQHVEMESLGHSNLACQCLNPHPAVNSKQVKFVPNEACLNGNVGQDNEELRNIMTAPSPNALPMAISPKVIVPDSRNISDIGNGMADATIDEFVAHVLTLM